MTFGWSLHRVQPCNSKVDGTRQKAPTLGLVLKKLVDLGNGAVEGTDLESMVSNIHDQVLAHDGQTNEAHICTGGHPRRSADIDAGETGAAVSSRTSSERLNNSKEGLLRLN